MLLAIVLATEESRPRRCPHIRTSPLSSNEPNLKVRSIPVSMDGTPKVWFFALRDIEPGEELTYDCDEPRSRTPENGCELTPESSACLTCRPLLWQMVATSGVRKISQYRV